MQKLVDYIKGILGDTDGLPSSKRIVSVIFSLLVMIAFVGNMVWGWSIDDNLLDAVMMIIIAGLGITGIEKFAPKIESLKKKDV
jgi:uncharacterized membrane protein YhaH (DUF805 family)